MAVPAFLYININGFSNYSILFKYKLNPWPQQFMQLSSMLEAGLSVEHALKTLAKNISKHPKRDQQKLQKIIYGISKGSTFSSALITHNVLDKFDSTLLKNAEIAGRLPQGLEHISKLKLGRQKMVKSMSGLALLPKAMLLIGALAGFFVRIAQQGQAPLQAIIDVSIVFLLTVVAIKILIFMLTINARIPLSLAWNMPFIKTHSNAFQQHFEQRFYHSLTWHLTSGIDSANAIKNNALLLSNKTYQKNVKQASQQASTGTSLPDTIIDNGLALSKRMQQTLSLADTAGTSE